MQGNFLLSENRGDIVNKNGLTCGSQLTEARKRNVTMMKKALTFIAIPSGEWMIALNLANTINQRLT